MTSRLKRHLLLSFFGCGLVFYSFYYGPSINPLYIDSRSDLQYAKSNRRQLLQETKKNYIPNDIHSISTKTNPLNNLLYVSSTKNNNVKHIQNNETKDESSTPQNINKYVKIPPGARGKDSYGVTLCSSKVISFEYMLSKYRDVPAIYFITPTYPRTEQLAELTRLSNTLLHISNLHWIIAEDFPTCSNNLHVALERFGIPYTHLSSPMPEGYVNNIEDIRRRPRGVANRMAGLRWVLDQRKKFLKYAKRLSSFKSSRLKEHFSSVLYFGDDDNT